MLQKIKFIDAKTTNGIHNFLLERQSYTDKGDLITDWVMFISR